jgi:hypothetical protein
MAVKLIRIRRGAKANLPAVTAARSGEPLFATDTKQLFVNDGSTNIQVGGQFGNAQGTYVEGNDARLSNSRPASDVSAWAKAANKPAYTASEVGAIPSTAAGAANGVAQLDGAGKVPAAQLPSYVDDYEEFTNLAAFPATGAEDKIYLAKDTNKTYRWSGSQYSVIGSDLALGETSATAYRGDRGATAYTHSQVTTGANPHNTTFANIASKPTTLAGYGITDAEATFTELDGGTF